MEKKKESILLRSKENRIIAGVCGGLGEFFKIDPTVIRIIFILITLFGGSGGLLYLILWLIIPSENKGKEPKDLIRDNAKEIKDETKELIKKSKNYSKKEEGRLIIGMTLMILGLMFLLENFNIFRIQYLFRLWPLILIVIALGILFKKND
ncbi:MAG: Phage shock protein C, PspC [Candidatus Woesebacteria bacterium]|jgi:phage shock protein C|nr:MAG: Phage shock protein C, PspC [Candidatus Woesebacteria bacterium]